LRGALAVYRGPNEAAELFSGTTLAQAPSTAPWRERAAAIWRCCAASSGWATTTGRGRGLHRHDCPPPKARAVERALGTRPHHPTLRAAARALGISPIVLRGRLRLGQALHALGDHRHASC